MLLSTLFLSLLAVISAAINATVVDKAYIIKLSPGATLPVLGRSLNPHEYFHKRAQSLQYTTRFEFKNPALYLGISIEVTSPGTDAEIQAQLKEIPGVVAVYPVFATTPTAPVPLHRVEGRSSKASTASSSAVPPLPIVGSTGNISSALKMGGVDKLHALGIKGKGVKIGIIDTGVDYRHPALGGGFGLGFKFAGGYSFISDNGTIENSPDPLTTCIIASGGHGTHVSGIIGMDSVPGSFNLSGVAPEAALYMYKAQPACTYNGGGGSDILMAAFEKAAADGVDLISMSIGLGSAFAAASSDPLLSTIQGITSQGIAVITALGNDVSCLSAECSDLYTAEMPAIDPTVIGVGAIANSEFPTVYSAVDSAGATIQYASVYPLNFPNGADVFVLGDCTSNSFISAISAITNINKTILVFPSSIDVGTCYAANLGGQSHPWSGTTAAPVNIMGYNLPSTNPFGTVYDVPSPGFFDTTTYININAADGTTLTNNYDSAGGYTKYKLFFHSTASVSIPQASGGMVDYYSDYGPAVNTWEMKPQISAPGGHVLSTWPLVGGGYAVLSGTSMATPYVAGAYALVKSQFPHATIDQILALLQTNAKPVQWIYDTTITSTTVQQGAGLINVYDAIFAQTTISPGQLLISDNSPAVYGAANITIKNGSPASKTYSLSHKGAGYTDWQLGHFENTQLAQYGTANFTLPTVVVPASGSKTVSFSVIPPSGVNQQDIPVFAGFIEVSSNDGEVQHVPYSGPAYSLYNAEYFLFLAGGVSPSLSGTDVSGNSVSDTGFLEVDASLGWSMTASTLQWTTELLVYVLPGNTNITAENYGLNITTPPAYQPSSFAPNNTIFGYPSFGTVLNKTAFTPDYPGAVEFGDASVYQSDTVVTSSNGVSFSVGNGDYRFFYTILRWYGTSGIQKDYETYLSPVIRFVNGTS